MLVFTGRRYAKARSSLSAGVRLSVCLSVCHIRVLTAKHIVKLFSRPDISPIIQVS